LEEGCTKFVHLCVDFPVLDPVFFQGFAKCKAFYLDGSFCFVFEDCGVCGAVECRGGGKVVWLPAIYGLISIPSRPSRTTEQVEERRRYFRTFPKSGNR
jgi:hypothetical protein